MIIVRKEVYFKVFNVNLDIYINFLRIMIFGVKIGMLIDYVDVIIGRFIISD